MKNKEILNHIRLNLDAIKNFEGSDESFQIEDFVDSVKQLDGLINTYLYFQVREDGLCKINEHLFG